MQPIIKKLGGWNEVEKILKRRNISLTQQIRGHWRDRGLPWRVKFVLALAARRKGIDWKESDFYNSKGKAGS